MPITVTSTERGINLIFTGSSCYTFTRAITLDNGDNLISIMAYNKDNTIESDRDSVVIKHTSSILVTLRNDMFSDSIALVV
jgi:hypothetical protein